MVPANMQTHMCDTQEANMSSHTDTNLGSEAMVAVFSGSSALTNIAGFLLLQLVLPRLVPGMRVPLGRPHW